MHSEEVLNRGSPDARRVLVPGDAVDEVSTSVPAWPELTTRSIRNREPNNGPRTNFVPLTALDIASTASSRLLIATTMTVSKRVANARSGKYHSNVHKRGQAEETKQKASKLPVGPVMLGFFIFVVIGSAVLQIIRTATNPRELPA